MATLPLSVARLDVAEPALKSTAINLIKRSVIPTDVLLGLGDVKLRTARLHWEFNGPAGLTYGLDFIPKCQMVKSDDDRSETVEGHDGCGADGDVITFNGEMYWCPEDAPSGVAQTGPALVIFPPCTKQLDAAFLRISHCTCFYYM